MSESPIVLITGATSGLGRHAALHLAHRGYRVFAAGRRPQALESLREEAADTTLETVQLDVTDPDAIARAKALIDERTDGHGVDVLVNNAGYGLFAPLELVTDEDMRRQFDTNVFGALSVTRTFLPAMRERGRGRIINISSMGGRITFPFGGPYHATKYALEAMSDALRNEVGMFGVDVVLIEPGAFRTEFATRVAGEVSKYRDGDSVYAPLIRQADAISERSDALSAPPRIFVRTLERAIRRKRPRARYVTPWSAKLIVALMGRLLPTRLVDATFRWVIRRQLGRSDPRRRLAPGS